MPLDLLNKAEHVGRFLFLLKYIVLLVALRLLVGQDFWRIVPIKSPSRSIVVLIGLGTIGGFVAFAFRRLMALMSGVMARTETQDSLLRGPITTWLVILASGAFTEEFWRALCILALGQNGYSPTSAVLWPAFAFAVAHVAGLPPRIPGGLENFVPEMGIGVILGVLIMWSGSLLPASLASMSYYTSNLFWLRSHYSCAPRAVGPDR